MVLAVEQIERMRGGAQAHLMRCSNGGYYVVKFQNHPQGRKVLANELLGTRRTRRMVLPSPEPEVIEVREALIAHTEDLVIQLGRGRALCSVENQFDSRYPGEPAKTVVYDFLPDDQLREVSNLSDFCGVPAFDQWTCNTNGRQAIFFRDRDEQHYRGFIHEVSLKRDMSQAKALAYTVNRIHARDSTVEVTAITEVEPQQDNWQPRFVSEVLGEQEIRIVPMNRVERFAEELRVRLN